jgi:ABC-2 type transport system ATP-binding protein
MKNMVEVKDLKKRYGDKQAVNGVSFSVKKGEIFGILGPNGAGKTTTLEMMETLRSIDSGSVFIDGVDVKKDPQSIKYLIGVQPQSPAFQDKTRLVEVVQMFAAAYGEKVDAMQFLRDVDLEDKAKSYVESLSGGQKQRLSITTALVHGPKVFFWTNRRPVLIHKLVVTFGN